MAPMAAGVVAPSPAGRPAAPRTTAENLWRQNPASLAPGAERRPWTFAAAPTVIAGALGLAAAQQRHRRRAAQARRVCLARGPVARRLFSIGTQEAPPKTVIITGASSGLGLAAAKELAKSGDWLVVMACRDFSKAEKAARDMELPQGSFVVMHCDLAANRSVCQFVEAFRRLGRPLDALVCNAAVYFPNAHKEGAFLPGLFPGGGPRWSADGYELSFATNYLGHFLLCNLLLEDLQKSSVRPARCVILGTVTATVNDRELGGQIPPKADLGQLQGLKQGMRSPVTMLDGGKFDGAKAYKDSKVCDILLMKQLHKRFHESTGIVFSSMYPGCIAETSLFREHYPVFRALFPVLQKKVTKAYVSEKEAGRRLAKCVADPSYVTSGTYYSWGGEGGTGGEGGAEAIENTEKTSDRFLQYGSFRTLPCEDIGGQAGNDENGKVLWELSREMVRDYLK
eukprot:CAMPEP_0117575528 /NCGR_PEP_ID=MMETSP0784-20121206/62251_1 /TAXON_ID=39447 /ORGANISM="" /LENGTH=453 /DNA_ID=CAMNT_0005374597 /DNA_START=92 /DNA_END=1453 /DNA_ORIENTATION=+